MLRKLIQIKVYYKYLLKERAQKPLNLTNPVCKLLVHLASVDVLFYVITEKCNFL